jgi:hypothetical protein
MKKYSFLLGLALIILLFTQCSLDDEKEYYQAIGTLSKTEDSTIIVSDDNERLLVNNPGSLASLSNGDRVLAYFTLIKETMPTGIDYVISIRNYDKILFKPVIDITSENADSIGNDPIAVNRIEIVNNLMNLSFSYYGSGSVIHFINLVKQPGPIPTDTVDLEIRHNNRADYPAYVFNGLVSFDVQSLQNNTADSVIIHVEAKGFQQDFEKNLTYRY